MITGSVAPVLARKPAEQVLRPMVYKIPAKVRKTDQVIRSMIHAVRFVLLVFKTHEYPQANEF